MQILDPKNWFNDNNDGNQNFEKLTTKQRILEYSYGALRTIYGKLFFKIFIIYF
jgi:hypothetical protein